MFILTIIEIFLLIAYVGYLVYEYAQKDVPVYVKLLTFISWTMSFGIVFILPHDIYYTAQLHYDSTDLSGFNTICTLWTTIYWTNFILTWIVLPLFQEYEDAGEFTWRAKMYKSLKSNLILYGVFGLIGMAFCVYLIAINKLEMSAVLGLLVALANLFGIFLIVVLLGYGLVEIPKTYWRNSQYEQCLKNFRFEAIGVEEAKITIQYELEDQINLVLLIKKKYENHPQWKDHLEEILQKVPYDIVEQAETQITLDIHERVKKEIGTLTLSKLAELHRKAKRLSAEYNRALTKWDIICDQTFLIEDLLENIHSVERRVRSTLRQQRRGNLGRLLDTLTWFWYSKIKKVFLVTLCGIFTTLSIVVLLGQISIFTHVDLNIFGHLLKDDFGFLRVQVVVLIPLLYISFCSYYGLFHIRLAGMYGFYKHHHTDSPSLLFGSINFSRVSFPLAYNFLQMMSIKEKTPFLTVIGDMDFVPVIGASFSLILPILLILVSVFNFFDIYDKVLTIIGLPQLKFHIEQSEARVEEGKKLLYKARIQRERLILNQNSSRNKFQTSFGDIEMYPDISSSTAIQHSKQSTKQLRSSFQYSECKNLDDILRI